MPNFTGQLKGTSSVQTIASLNDRDGHQLMLRASNAVQTCSDPQFNNTKHSSWSTADLTNGNGTEHGYFTNEHTNGDRSSGSWEGKVTTRDSQVSFEGTWKYTSGTGQFSGITGNGKFKGHMTSPTQTEVSFEGSYQLKAGSKAA